MNLAFLLDARGEGERPGFLTRPFGDSSLLEIALEKLALLDAPVRKYVVVAERELEPLVRRHRGLTVLRKRAAGPEAGAPFAAAWSHLAALAESHFLCIDPCWPLVEAETWWSAAEQFLAADAGGLVAALRQDGRFHAVAGLPGKASVLRGTLFAECDAFRIVSKAAIFDEGRHFPLAGPPVAVFEIPSTARFAARDAAGFAAAEAVWSRSRLLPA